MNELEFCRELWGKLGGCAVLASPVVPLKSSTCLAQSVPLTDPNFTTDRQSVSLKVKVLKAPADYTLPALREFTNLNPTLTVGQLKHLLFPLPFEFLSILSKGKVLADDRQVGDYGGVELHCMVKPNATLLADGYPRTLPSLDGGVSGAVKPPAAVIPATVAMPSSVNNSSAKQSNGKHAPQLSPAFWAKVEDLLRQEQPMDPQLVVAISKSFRLAFEQTILSEQAKQQHNIIG